MIVNQINVKSVVTPSPILWWIVSVLRALGSAGQSGTDPQTGKPGGSPEGLPHSFRIIQPLYLVPAQVETQRP